MSSRLYVGNLSYDVTTDGLRNQFAECGDVTDLHVMMDRETGRARGFAFVTMQNEADAANAISQLNGAMYEGRAMRVNIAEERPRGGGGGAANRGGHRGW